MKKKRLRVILTGGTIASYAGEDGVIRLPRALPRALAALLEDLLPSDEWEVQSSSPYLIHSEDVNLHYWNLLLAHLREVLAEEPDAVFIVTGTDTLAYTSNLLALVCHGLPISIHLISSDLPPGDPASNAAANLSSAARAIISGNISLAAHTQGVYVHYRNKNGVMRVHRGERLLQAGDFSTNFLSVPEQISSKLPDLVASIYDAWRARGAAGTPGSTPLLYALPELTAHILCIRPYPAMDYGLYDLSRVDAILHGTYHALTASAEGSGLPELLTKADKAGVPVYLAPAPSGDMNLYATTEKIFRTKKAIPLPGLSFELGYAYLLVLYSKSEFCA